MVYKGAGLALVNTVMTLMELIDSCRRDKEVGKLLKHVESAEDIIAFDEVEFVAQQARTLNAEVTRGHDRAVPMHTYGR